MSLQFKKYNFFILMLSSNNPEEIRNRSDFDKIYPSSLTAKQNKIIDKVLQGKSDLEILQDSEIWNSKKSVDNPMLAEQSQLNRNYKNIFQVFKIKHLGSIEDELRILIKYFIKYEPRRVSDKARILRGLPNIKYQRRNNVDSSCEKNLDCAGKKAILIRLKGAGKVGKTKLLKKLLEYSENQFSNSKKIYIDFDYETNDTILNPNTFFKWFCHQIGNRLKLDKNDVDNYLDTKWNNGLTDNVKLGNYFKDFIIPRIDKILFLAIDNLHVIFKYPQLYDFLKFIRERGSEISNQENIWYKTVWIVAYATDNYPFVGYTSSPLNTGTEIFLEDFTEEEILNLSRKYNLQLNLTDIEELNEVIQGHPELTINVLRLLSEGNTLEQVLDRCETREGYFGKHLSQLESAVTEANLRHPLQLIIDSSRPIVLSPELDFYLFKMGLVKREGNGLLIRCPLYKNYFTSVLNNNQE